MTIPRKKRDETSATLTQTLGLVLAMSGLVVLAASAAGPDWWQADGVLNSNPPNDYAPVNQGQLKNFVRAATSELDASIPGGAGDPLHGLVAGWGTPTPQTDDYAPVNLGQLKAVAKPVYDRLIAVGYTNQYPWTNPGNPPNDYAPANIGQV
jgi:hypothetical protein